MYINMRRWFYQANAKLMMHATLYDAMPYCIFGLLFFANIFIMWPGQMSPDSYTQYKAAVQGVFDDHHPPMMSLLWGLLDAVYKGPALLFLLHLVMLYSACLLFMSSVASRSIKLYYAMFPCIPHILFYSSMLWKDVGFAFSFLCALAILHYHISKKIKMNIGAVVAVLVLIFYGSAVKFQGQYVAPIMIFGVWYCLDGYTIKLKTILKTVVWSWLFLYTLQSFNNFFVPPMRKAHSWQCVKMYDLAAISLDLQESVFPSFITQAPDFSMQKIAERFNHKRVDDLFMPPGNPIRLCKNEAERSALLASWHDAIKNNFVVYMRHRFTNWWTMVTNMPLQRFEALDFSRYGGLQWFVSLQKAAQEHPSNVYDFTMHYTGKLIGSVLYALRYCFRFVFLLPFMFFYFLFFLGFYVRRDQGMSLILMNGLSLCFLIILLFCSMASDMRYAYIAACLTYASHGIAIDVWQKRRNVQTR